MKLLLISLASVVVLGILLLTTRLWGLGQQYPDFQHPFFNDPKPLIILKVASRPQIDEALKQMPDVAFWLDVETTSDKKLIVFSRDFSHKEMSVEAFRGPKSQSYTLQELKNVHPEVMEVHDVLAQHPSQRFVLNILDNVENVHIWINDALKGLEPEKRILIQSNYNVIMTAEKELEPFWLYGCSQADLMRFLTFQSMWILPAVPFQGDVFVAPRKILGRPAYSEEILEEARRRHKKIILGPILSKEGFDYASRLNPDGLMIENLSDFLGWPRP